MRTLESPHIELSALDFSRFGIRTAKAAHVNEAFVKNMGAFCREHRVQLCIARCATTEAKAVQALEQQGYQLMDTLIYYELRLHKIAMDFEVPKEITIRFIHDRESSRVKTIAEQSFKGYAGHYHHDHRLPKTKSDEVYADWCYRQAEALLPSQPVLVAEVSGAVSAFATLRANSPEEGEGVLFGVDPLSQGRGLYKYLMIKSVEWCLAQKMKRMIVSTQITNVMVQKVWTTLGFVPAHSMYTLHGWFDSAQDRHETNR